MFVPNSPFLERRGEKGDIFGAKQMLQLLTLSKDERDLAPNPITGIRKRLTIRKTHQHHHQRENFSRVHLSNRPG